jgi:signal transduction histidine kinase
MITIPFISLFIFEVLVSIIVITLGHRALSISANSLARDPENPFWLFLNWLTLVFVIFAYTHLASFITFSLSKYIHVPALALAHGIFAGLDAVTYVVIAVIILFFHRIQRIYRHMETDHRHLEETSKEILALSCEMESCVMERTIKEMALGIADGIRNPLLVIGGLSHRLVKKPGDPQATRRHAQTIAKQAQDIEQLVERFETLAQRKVPLFKQGDLNLLVTKSLDLLRPELKNKKISLLIDLSDGPLLVRYDEQLLRVALSHLLRNAIEATAPGGTLLVHTTRDRDHTILTIKDTGRGMTPEMVEKIFIPYYTTKIGGTGLGMVLVRQIVDDHRGEISLESKLARGTTVTIKLPHRFVEYPGVSEAPGPPSAPSSSDPPSGPPPRDET